MAQLLAPYNNSMRLGQGFNSYTQQICLDRAVLPDTTQNRTQMKKTITLAKGRKAPVVGAPTAAVNGQSNPAEPKQIAGNDEKEDIHGNEDEESDDEESGAVSQHPRPQPHMEQEPVKVFPWVKPQIVTYSSRFVDKLSDVTDAMNVSGSLSIKTATIGGKASGTYVDSDKFKSSDINFHLQVKVTNQIHDATNYNIFNKIPNVTEAKFPEVYGDTFISGWEEGGELNAIISIKVLDKSKIFQIKAGIEAELTTPSIAGRVEAKVDMDKSTLSRDTETTIAVNWSGGGSIKNSQDDWSIDTLKKAAAAFPDLVAVTPQRVYACLTKYTALESFHRQQTDFKPLDYENAGIYTGALLDAYMDYKSLWKQISNATYELEGNRATIDMGEPSEEMIKLAAVREFPATVEEARRAQAAQQQITDGNDDADTKKKAKSNRQIALFGQGGRQNKDDPDITELSVFAPTFAGLIQARKVCRFEMSKIVKEVDLVATDPTLAADPVRDGYFLHPLVFKQLLPIVRSLSPENATLGVRDPTATLLLGYSQPKTDERGLPLLYVLAADIKEHTNALRKSFEKLAYKGHNYRLQGCVGPISDKDVHSRAKFFNDLEKLDQTYRVIEIAVWAKEKQLSGIQTRYANGEVRRSGTCEGPATQALALKPDGSEVIVEVAVEETFDDEKNESWISSLNVATSACKVLQMRESGDPECNSSKKTDTTVADTGKGGSAPSGDTAQESKSNETKPKTEEDNSNKKDTEKEKDSPKPPAKPLRTKTTTWLKPEDPRYSLRGWFGYAHITSILTLGCVWGKDSFVPVPPSKIQPALFKTFLGLSPALQTNIDGHTAASAGVFLLGNSITTHEAPPADTKHFNALDDIDTHWALKTLGFATAGDKLCGLRATYHNGKTLTHGTYTPALEAWHTDTLADLVIAKLGVREKTPSSSSSFIDTVEFIRTDSEGNLSDWPLEFSTLRFVGRGEKVVVGGEKRGLVEAAPRIGNAKWSVRGFYGECTGEQITRLGMVWGRG